MPTCYQLDFNMSRDEFIAASRVLVNSDAHWAPALAKYRRDVWRQMLYLGPVIIVGAAFFIGRGDSTRGMYIPGALAGVVLVFLMIFGQLRLDRLTPLKKEHLAALERADLSQQIGPTSVTVDEHGAHIRTGSRDLKLKWTAVTPHDVGDSILLSYGGADGTFIPKRELVPYGGAPNFLEQVLQWWRAAQLPPAERLALYLAGRDLPCPGCKYNLRGCRSVVCPECGRELNIESLTAGP